MDAYTTEEQDLETLKKWWRDNGKSVLAGIVIGLAVIFGLKLWQSYQTGTHQEASQAYENIVVAVEQEADRQALEAAATDDTKEASTAKDAAAGTQEQASEPGSDSSSGENALMATVTPLLEQTKGTAYDYYGRFLLAKQAVDSDDLEQAREFLMPLAEAEPEDEALAYMASLRLARVYLGLQSYDKALDVLPELSQTDVYFAEMSEIKGDILLAKGDKQLARDAYQQSLTAAQQRPLVELKLNDLR